MHPYLSAAEPVLAGVIGPWQLLLVVFILLLLFGRRIPGVARSLGQGISSFKKGLAEGLDDDDAASKKDLPKGNDAPAP